MEILELIRSDYPITMHGVSLSIGSPGLQFKTYLKKLKKLVDRVQPFLVSDHLCFTGTQKGNLHNLLPLVYNQETLNELKHRLDEVQNYLGRPILLENLSAYFSYQESEIPEWEFLNQLSHSSGCKILLDINNVYVNSHNFGFDPYDFLKNIKPSIVGQIHLAGFSDLGNFYFDTHSRPVCSEVWKLYEYYISQASQIPTLIEWDEDVPEFSELESELLRAKSIWRKFHHPKQVEFYV